MQKPGRKKIHVGHFILADHRDLSVLEILPTVPGAGLPIFHCENFSVGFRCLPRLPHVSEMNILGLGVMKPVFTLARNEPLKE